MNRRLFTTAVMGLLILAALSLTVTSCNDDDDKTEEPLVSDEALCPDDNHPHAIDLGIGVKWACCNVGAKKTWDSGNYYAWGETEPGDNFNPIEYKYYDKDNKQYIDIGSTISGTDYDVAHVAWKGDWRMPTNNDYSQLKKCKVNIVSYHGVEGAKITGLNGNAIFLPFVGYKTYGVLQSAGADRKCFIWSAGISQKENTKAYSFMIYSGFNAMFLNRFAGVPVRPVTN